MKTKAGLALVACALSITAAALFGADASLVAGKWATDAVANVEMPQSAGWMSKALGSAINGGSTTSSIGNTSGTTQVTAPTMSSGRGGGGMGRGTFPGAGGASARGIASSVKEEEPAILMELKVDAKGKLTGEVQEITTSPVFALKKAKVEEGTVTDKKFEFKTTEKSEKVSNTTRWVGELTDDQTITVNRLTKGGQPIDSGALVLHRGK